MIFIILLIAIHVLLCMSSSARATKIYIGSTTCQLRSRIQEHRRACATLDASYSLVLAGQ